MFTGAAAQAQLFRDTARGEAVERHLPGDRTFTQWARDPAALATQGGDRVEMREVATTQVETVKLTNVVPAIHFESGVAEIPDSTVASLRQILVGMRDKQNVRLHLVGHADTQPLSPALAAKFGDNEGLSRERAGEAAEFLQRSLDLPADSIAYEWAGDTKPVASNATDEGRAKNRRVEVEVWYDKPKAAVALQEVLVKDEFRRVKVCRTETVCRLRYREGEERRTRVKMLAVPSLAGGLVGSLLALRLLQRGLDVEHVALEAELEHVPVLVGGGVTIGRLLVHAGQGVRLTQVVVISGVVLERQGLLVGVDGLGTELGLGGAVGDGAGDHQRQALAARFKFLFAGENGSLGIERVKHRLDQDQIGATVEQAGQRFAIAVFQLVKADIAKRRVINIR